VQWLTHVECAAVASPASLADRGLLGASALPPPTVEANLNVLVHIVEVAQNVTEGGAIRDDDDQILNDQLSSTGPSPRRREDGARKR
jgi:hypothetical protein